MHLFRKNLVLAIGGALLLWAAWPTSPLTILIFVAWVPMLMLADRCKNAATFFGLSYLHMILWNVLVTWWVAKASVEGGLSAFFANSLIMCLPWLLYFLTKKHLKGWVGGLSIVAFWLVFEYIHHNWDLSWPWLTLGNVFATRPGWIQWYEYTGTSGGSLWVLLSNIMVFYIWKLYLKEGRTVHYFKNLLAWIALILGPVLFSLFIKNDLTLEHNKYNVVVVQPNIDPYLKFDATKQEEQLQKLISLSQQQIDANTALVVWPETAIPFQSDETRLKENARLEPLWNFLKNNPHVNLLTGLEGYREFDEKISRYAKPFQNGMGFYEMYNSAILCDSSQIQVYHKSKLVPGVEVLPGFLSFMAPVFEKFGGTGGGYARDTSAKNLPTPNRSFNVTPAICYESIYGDYLADFNRKNSNLICVITNDGWWGNTEGYRQHMNYARLRAIESRKWVARSANTGVSCFIDPYGHITQQLDWEKEGALKQKVAAFVSETFYTKYGDWISKVFCVVAAALLLLAIIKRISSKKINHS